MSGWASRAVLAPSARPVANNAIIGGARLAGVGEAAHLAAATGADRAIFACAECLFPATAAAPITALAVADDAVSGPVGKAGIGEGLAIAAAPGTDWLILHGAELRFGPWRAWTRTRAVIHHDRAGGKDCRQEQGDKTLTREDCRQKLHDYSPQHPARRKPAMPRHSSLFRRRMQPPFAGGDAFGKARREPLDAPLYPPLFARWPMLGPSLADDPAKLQVYPLPIEINEHHASGRAHQGDPRHYLATFTFPCDKFRVRAFATRRAERFGRPFPDTVNL